MTVCPSLWIRSSSQGCLPCSAYINNTAKTNLFMTDTVGPTCKFIRRHGQRTWRQSRSIAICFLLMTLPESRRAAQRRTQTIVQTPQWLKPQHRHAFDVHLSLQSLCQRWMSKFGLNVQLFRQAKFNMVLSSRALGRRVFLCGPVCAPKRRPI